MATQALTLPLDITWQRFGYSRDMIDTNFGDLKLPPKWRSSMAVYSYVVPHEQTAEDYPDSRIVYLRLTCSITGWNLDEELQVLEQEVDIGDLTDDVQKSVFEAFQAGLLSEYSPCTSAIAQIAVYPHNTDDVGPDDYPFIMDFEPKKRELYETRSESGEFLSGTNENLKINKGTTSTESTEKTTIQSVDAGFKVGAGPVSIGGGASQKSSTLKSKAVETVDMQTTDTSREKRESTSFTTTFNQMYQLFNGYHLGTNRALFYIQARPHTASQSTEKDPHDPQVDINLINGERKLEGLQDMFLVVRVPNTLKGICVQANLDTGHTINVYEEFIEGQPGRWEARRLLVTRRIIQNCGLFQDEDRLVPSGVPGPFPGTKTPITVSFESKLDLPLLWLNLSSSIRQPTQAAPSPPITGKVRVGVANELNLCQQQASREMFNGFTSGRYKVRNLEDTETFALLVGSILKGSKLTLGKLLSARVLTRADLMYFRDKFRVQNVGDFFDTRLDKEPNLDKGRLKEARRKITDHATKPAKRNGRN